MSLMTMNPVGPLTNLLDEFREDEHQTADQLFAKVYDELKHLAGRQMRRERPGRLLQPTALVHEAYLRLMGRRTTPFANRAHFFGAAAEAMRRILIDHARGRNRLKRGAGLNRVPLVDLPDRRRTSDVDLFDLDRALRELQDVDQHMCDVVKLRYFVGLTIDETADAMGVSTRTVNRLWVSARAWLHQELSRTLAA